MCVLLILLGASVAAGWLLEIDSLKSILPNLSTMKFNTALAFIAAGGGVWLAGEESPSRRKWCLAPAAFLLLLGGLSLAQYVLGANFGIDEWLVEDTGLLTGSGHPGRMSPLAAVAFISLGVGMVDPEAPRHKR